MYTDYADQVWTVRGRDNDLRDGMLWIVFRHLLGRENAMSNGVHR